MSSKINFDKFLVEEEKDEIASKKMKKKIIDDEEGWESASVEGVSVDGQPLDGYFFERMVDQACDEV